MAAAIRYTGLAVAAGGIGVNFRITPLASPMRPLIATQIGKTRVIPSSKDFLFGNCRRVITNICTIYRGCQAHFAEGKWRRQRWDNLYRFGTSNAPRQTQE